MYERNGDCDEEEEEKVKERRRMRKRNSITAKAAANAFDRWMSEAERAGRATPGFGPLSVGTGWSCRSPILTKQFSHWPAVLKRAKKG